MQKSLAFYGNVLGMHELKPPDQFSTVCWFEAGGTEIHLILQGDEHLDPNSPHSEEAIRIGGDSHIAFTIASIDDAVAHLNKLGIEIVCGPRPCGDGPDQLYIQNPDGYLIELFTQPN